MSLPPMNRDPQKLCPCIRGRYFALLDAAEDQGILLTTLETIRDIRRQQHYVSIGASQTLHSKHLPQQPNNLSLAFDTTWGDARYLLSSAYTAGDILTKLLTVDGTGSGLDADLLDGQSSAYYTDIVSRLGYTPVTNARTITAGTGLSGGTQDLSANRTISFDQTWGDGRYSLSGHTHSYVPLSGGTMTGTLNVKNGTVGYVAAVSGDASNPGYMAFHTSEGTRRGYIGWASGTQLLFTAEVVVLPGHDEHGLTHVDPDPATSEPVV